jgi:hypothetical protein
MALFRLIARCHFHELTRVLSANFFSWYCFVPVGACFGLKAGRGERKAGDGRKRTDRAHGVRLSDMHALRVRLDLGE